MKVILLFMFGVFVCGEMLHFNTRVVSFIICRHVYTLGRK